MPRHVLFPAAGLIILFAAQQAYADNISCSFTAKGGPNGSSSTIEIDSFSFGIEQTANVGSATGGSGAGKVKFGEFTITKTADSASPKLLQSLVTSEIFSKVICKFYGEPTDTGAALSPYLTAEMTDAALDKFQIMGDGSKPREELSFAFAAIEWKY